MGTNDVSMSGLAVMGVQREPGMRGCWAHSPLELWCSMVERRSCDCQSELSVAECGTQAHYARFANQFHWGGFYWMLSWNQEMIMAVLKQVGTEVAEELLLLLAIQNTKYTTVAWGRHRSNLTGHRLKLLQHMHPVSSFHGKERGWAFNTSMSKAVTKVGRKS